MRRLIGPVVAALWLAAVAPAAFAYAEEVEETWRSPFGVFRGMSVNAADGSCWVADRGNGELARYGVVGYAVQPFADVPGDSWAFDAIAACVEADIVQGYWNNTYRPEEPVTRAQMAVYISRGLAGGDEGVQVPTAVAEPTFSDVDENYWAYRYIEYCVGANIVEGYPDGGYHPEEVVNRGQMAVYMARTLVAPSGDAAIPHYDDGQYHEQIVTGPVLLDVTPDNEWAWCYDHVMYCVVQGVVQGYPEPDGGSIQYKPAYAVTRDQMAVFVARAFHLTQ